MGLKDLCSPSVYLIAILCIGQVYKKSYAVCTQLYEKELLTDNSYLHIYGYSFCLSICADEQDMELVIYIVSHLSEIGLYSSYILLI